MKAQRKEACRVEGKLTKEPEEQISAARSLVDVVKLCTHTGIPVTKEQLEAAALPEAFGELTEEALDAVSGGSVYYAFQRFLQRHCPHRSGGRRF